MIRYTKDIMHELKNAGWSEYKLRRENRLPSSVIKSLKAWDTGISMRSLNTICELLGGVQPYTIIEYYDPIKNAGDHGKPPHGVSDIRNNFGKPL